MAVISSQCPCDETVLDQALQDAQQKIADLEEKLAHAVEVQQAGTALLIATLVSRLGGEVLLSNDEMGAIKGELQSYETFGGRIFRLVPSDTNSDDDDRQMSDS